MKQNPLLESVNRQLSVDVQWQPLANTGTTNQLYSGCYQAQPVVLRLNAAEQVMGVCRQREDKVFNLIRNHVWAPDVLYQQMADQSQPGWLLMKQYVTLADAPVADIYSQILTCMTDWQQIKYLPRFDYQGLWNKYQQKIDNLGGCCQAQGLLDSIRVLMKKLDELAPVKLCLVHHDLHPGNLLNDAGQLIIIDWEYAGLGTPWLDAAALVTEFSIPIRSLAALPAFRHLDSETFANGIRVAQQINQQLNMLWCACR